MIFLFSSSTFITFASQYEPKHKKFTVKARIIDDLRSIYVPFSLSTAITELFSIIGTSSDQRHHGIHTLSQVDEYRFRTRSVFPRIRPYFSVLHVTVLRSYISVTVYDDSKRPYLSP